MEDVLDTYALPYDSQKPLICLDEKPYVLHGDVSEPLPTRRMNPKKIDYEYTRNGYCAIIGLIEPLTGKQYVDVRERRTSRDFAEVIKWIVDVLYPSADKIILVMDNLNIHKIGSLYQRFEPKEARRLAGKLEVHYTPKHGSWLNIAEIGLNLLSRQCLNRRIPEIEQLRQEVTTWCSERNKKNLSIDWQFTTADARIKLHSLYPKIED